MNLPIAVFMNDIGPAVLPRTERKNLFGIVRAESALEIYTRKHCRMSVIPIHYQSVSSEKDMLDDVILHTDIAHQLCKKKVSTLIVPVQQSTRATAWATRNAITLLAPTPKLQRSLEDKIEFDEMMRQKNIVVPPLVDEKKISSEKKIVVQKRRGVGGGDGTMIFNSPTQSKSIFAHTSLIREYIDGVALGVSIIIDGNGNYFCSALRRQCFVMNKKNSPQLLGLQWVPTTSFSKKSIAAIEQMTAQLISFFLDIHFVGVANIDFILAKDGAYVIECNPRFSGATPQVFSKKSLTPHPRPWRFLMNAFLHKKNTPFHESSIPLSAYEGSLTYIDAEKKMNFLGNAPVGTYTVRGGVAQLSRPRNKSSFFLLHDLPKHGLTADKGDTICYILSDAPLFSDEGELTRDAMQLRMACSSLFTPL